MIGFGQQRPFTILMLHEKCTYFLLRQGADAKELESKGYEWLQ